MSGGLRAAALLAASAAAPAAPPPRLLYAVAAGAAHDLAGHAENAARVPAILDALAAGGLDAAGRPGAVVELAGFAPAPLGAVTALHDARYVAALEAASAAAAAAAAARPAGAPPAFSAGLVRLDEDTYATPSTYADALAAAGAVMALVDAVVAGAAAAEAAGGGAPAPAGFAVCRPPGHHALRASAMGFCVLSTAAIAARHAQRAHGLARVAVFDFDVHHGNGTNDLFYADPSVLFISTHQQGSFPNTGKLDEAGAGDGQGATVNVPLPGDAGDAAARDAWDAVVGPALERFRPDIILCSAGYDAHWRDPLAGLQYRSSTYHELSARLVGAAARLSGGRLVFLLEGGYDPRALGESVANTFRAVLGKPPVERTLLDPALLRDEPADKVRAVLAEARRIHSL